MGAGKRFSAEIADGEGPAAALAAAQRAVDGFAATENLESRDAARLSVVIEEVLANSIRHGGARRVSFDLESRPGAVAIVLLDDGQPFDPTAPRAFDGPDEQTGGGVGLALLNAWGRELRYSRGQGRNRLALELRLGT